jgi:hypothetical protein
MDSQCAVSKQTCHAIVPERSSVQPSPSNDATDLKPSTHPSSPQYLDQELQVAASAAAAAAAAAAAKERTRRQYGWQGDMRAGVVRRCTGGIELFGRHGLPTPVSCAATPMSKPAT